MLVGHAEVYRRRLPRSRARGSKDTGRRSLNRDRLDSRRIGSIGHRDSLVGSERDLVGDLDCNLVLADVHQWRALTVDGDGYSAQTGIDIAAGDIHWSGRDWTDIGDGHQFAGTHRAIGVAGGVYYSSCEDFSGGSNRDLGAEVRPARIPAARSGVGHVDLQGLSRSLQARRQDGREDFGTLRIWSGDQVRQGPCPLPWPRS